MSMTVNNNTAGVSWQAVFDAVNTANNAEKVSGTNRNLTFSVSENGVETSYTVRIPDDLDLPETVTPEKIDSLVDKMVAASNITLSEASLAEVKESITKICKQMMDALDTTMARSTGGVMFDLYQLMALLVEVAQSQRNAARDLRNTENQQIQNAIQSQADAQRDAAIVGLVVGVVCGVASALVSVGMLVGQSVAYKSQVSAARSSGLDAAQNNVTTLKSADTSAHAQAQLTKIENAVGAETAAQVKNAVNEQVQPQKAAFESAKQKVAERQQTLDAAQTELDTATANQTAKQTAVDTAQQAFDQAKAAAEVPEGKTALQAKQDYLRQCAENRTESDPQKLAKYDAAVAAETRLNDAKTAHHQATELVTQKETSVSNARDALRDANTELNTARGNYRAALKTAADGYADTYESTLTRDAPTAEVRSAKADMRMARAYVANELAQDGVTTASEHRQDVVSAQMRADTTAQGLNSNLDYRDALRSIEKFAAINAINVALGNMLQSMTQSISGMINSEATRMGAEKEKEQEQLDQTKDLFSQAQSVVDAAIQLMNAVRSAETQSMRDAIQA